MDQAFFNALVHMLLPGVHCASSDLAMSNGLAAACAGSAASASVCCERSSCTLHVVDLSTELDACSPIGVWAPFDLSKSEDPDVAAFLVQVLSGH